MARILSPAAIVFAGTLVFVTVVGERPAAAVERTRALHRVAFRAAEDAEPATPPADFVERRVVVMGTTLDVIVRLPEREAALAASERAVSEIARVEGLLTTWRQGGPLWKIDHAPAGQSVAVDPELAAVLALVFEWSRRTGGAFDPTVLPLVEAWGLRSGGRIPSAEEIAAARRATGTDRFRLSAPDRTIVRLDERAGIDEGAWGKGYALDRAAQRLARAGVADARLDLGGQVLVLGKGTGGRPWTVGLAHPEERDRPVARLRLPPGASLSTSGNSQRGVPVAGRRIGHLLDPRTGRPAPDFGSVSVLALSGCVADVLSTAFFVLGPADGLVLSERLRREGVANEVLYLSKRGSRLEALASPGLSAYVVSADTDTVIGLSGSSPEEAPR